MSSPKAYLHHLYLNSKIPLRYVSELVPIPQESTAHLPVTLLIPAASPQQKGFRCTLYLPNFPPVVSDIFPRKKEAEQDAAKKALVQMGNVFSSQDSASRILTPQERFSALVQRVGIVFFEKSVINYQPLKEHFRAAITCKGERHGFVPATALAALDTKIISLCRSLHELVDLSPACSLALVWAAAESCSSVICDKGGLWMRRVVPFTSDFEIELLSDEGVENSSADGTNNTDFQEVENPDVEGKNNTHCQVVENAGVDGKNNTHFQVVYIPHFHEEEVFTCQLKVRANEYYMDVMAAILGVKDGASVLMSRTIPRAPHATRLYWPAPDILPAVLIPRGDYMPECTDRNKIYSDQMICDQDHTWKTGPLWNKRASDLVGFTVDGDAILASIGSSWKSGGKLARENLSLSCYYRLIMGKNPEGNYKLSRESILAAKLPNSYSGRSQWRGGLPRSLLIDFCHQHRLPEPVFSLSCSGTGNNTKSDDEQINSMSQKSYKCMVQVTYNYNTLECESEHSYRSRADAVQSAALKALILILKSMDEFEDKHLQSEVSASLIVPSSIAETFEKIGRPVESLALQKDLLGNETQTDGDSFLQTLNGAGGRKEQSKALAPGSIVCISYHVCLVGGEISVNLEGQDEFEFELGTGGVIGDLEGHVSTMRVGDSKQFLTPLPCMELLLAAQGDVIDKIDKCTLSKWCLRYTVKALRCLEPPEERMESALFSPPLSKQRNEFAIRRIQEAHAKSLVDLGCGSGSLLDALFDHHTELEHIAGVDISQKSLVRAAKSLHAKLGPYTDQGNRLNAGSLKSAVLYEGSLAEADLRLCGFDVATCIEVVEHMDPEPLSKVGEIILGIWSPRMLILSTPNIEFNPILQRMTVEAKPTSGQCKNEKLAGATRELALPDLLGDANGNAKVPKTNTKVSGAGTDASASLEDLQMQNIVLFDDENGPQTSKLRNDDHRFEWTRAEFREWAEKLALEFGYTIEYSGVGGSEDDPGFASQIAIFTHNPEKKSPEPQRGAQEPERYRNGSTDLFTEVWKYDCQGLVVGPV